MLQTYYRVVFSIWRRENRCILAQLHDASSHKESLSCESKSFDVLYNRAVEVFFKSAVIKISGNEVKCQVI